MKSYPRVIIAGLGGDSGKTFVSCGLLRFFRDKGFQTGAYKKGPDYIDAAWLKLASGSDTRNLDTYLIAKENLLDSFFRNSINNDINIIEGNRGLYDGFDSNGTHSTAELAKLLNCPVILVINVTKITRTAAALVLGCKMMDSEVNIAGIILNHVAGKRHEEIIRKSIESITGIPVIGAIPKINENLLPSRHLGLITPGEYDSAENAIIEAKEIINQYVDTKAFIEIASEAGNMEYIELFEKKIECSSGIKIGYFRDKIFSFYYPENLEALEQKGIELVKISSYEDKELPDIDALYIGGGFPESNINYLIDNHTMMVSVKKMAESGLPIYAECGGLIYLGESIDIFGKEFQLSGVLPLKFSLNIKPIGHGYSEAEVDINNPFFNIGTKLKGHEFHYSNIVCHNDELISCFKIHRGKGSINKRDGILFNNVLGSYIHIHAAGCPDWVEGMFKAAKLFKQNRKD